MQSPILNCKQPTRVFTTHEKECRTMPQDMMYGKTLRKSFARTQEIMDMPNLLEIQKNSY